MTGENMTNEAVSPNGVQTHANVATSRIAMLPHSTTHSPIASRNHKRPVRTTLRGTGEATGEVEVRRGEMRENGTRERRVENAGRREPGTVDG